MVQRVGLPGESGSVGVIDRLAEGGDIELREVKLHVRNLSVHLDVVIRSVLGPLIAHRELPASPSPRSGGRSRSAH